MNLPGGDDVVIPDAKLRDYLLSQTHPIGRAKAGFFRALGFDESTINDLAQSLRMIAATAEVIGVQSSPYGSRRSRVLSRPIRPDAGGSGDASGT